MTATCRRTTQRTRRSITPLDMRQTAFASGWRGYSREAVRSFLVEASESYEQALRDNERLRQEIERLAGRRFASIRTSRAG